jgi:putative PEP-CTERM system TPR-repeat lipoprotein
MMALAKMADAAQNDKEMVSWLEQAAKANPGAVPPRLLLVRYHLAKKEPKKALALANEMANANPDSLEALEVLGAAQLATGDQANAIATLVKATQKAPQSPDVFFRLGQVQLVAKRLDDARNSFEKALSFNTGHRQALDTLIYMDLSDKKPNAALSRVSQIQVKFPNSPVGYEREGALQMSQREYVQAAKAYEQAITRGADSGSAIMLHRALVAAADKQAAEKKLAAWMKAHPKDVAVRAYAAEFRMLTGQNVAAIALYEELLRQVPQSPGMFNNLAVLYQREKDKRALTTAEQAYKLTPEHPVILDTLGWILVEQGQMGRGVELLRKAVEKAPKADSVRYHYAVALARTGKQPQAKQELDALIKSKRAFPELEDAKALLAKL